ncbi:glycoside hydrolase family 132 protein [Lentithecium fluviatile CBS 122367]|uniref:Glycoside hydrolase family 132 protein n=1 Tax=Lentithecium fluviatile CBS 122367 TaxID=1168545 RepID=A0A6G1JEZ8_9PLEO|nr:glycoside hydrolase family 132 protein [Lentithecium fluviatile CBS 122367]
MAAAGVTAVPRRHAHRHAHRVVAKRESDAAAVYVPGPVQTIVVYELNGHPISEEEVRQGIANGTLAWGNHGILTSSSLTATAAPTPTPAQTTESQHQSEDKPEEHGEQPQPQQPSPSSAPEPQGPAPPSVPGIYQPIDNNGNCPDCDKEFQNNHFSCDQFPDGFGAVALHNEGLGGWTGIQDPVYRGADGFDDIMTVSKDSCKDGSCCTPGRFCSYGCPNPYLKMSFPKMQGKTRQSVGGLYCNENGKLEMADGSIGKTLCGKGSEHMKVKVQNKLKKSVSICRTDYPGTESETIPLTVKPGETGELANPDQGTYYFWDGKATSAHYYINKQGVPESEACTWGTDSKKAVGNWAPLIFGTSFDDRNMRVGFSSLKQNELIWNDRADFTATFTGEGVKSPCKYKHITGEFCQDANCGRDVNCTASVKEGSTLTLVFTDD